MDLRLRTTPSTDSMQQTFIRAAESEQNFQDMAMESVRWSRSSFRGQISGQKKAAEKQKNQASAIVAGRAFEG